MLKFNDKETVSGMISPEKEHVDFGVTINVNEGERKGNVEKWLLEIEELMIKSLKKINHLCLHDYSPRTKWA